MQYSLIALPVRYERFFTNDIACDLFCLDKRKVYPCPYGKPYKDDFSRRLLLRELSTRVTEGIGSPATRKKYEYNFKCFLKHYDIANKEMLLDIQDPRVIEGYIIQYIKYLSSERKLVNSTIHFIVAAITHFFDMRPPLIIDF